MSEANELFRNLQGKFLISAHAHSQNTRSRRRQFRGIFKYKCGICSVEKAPAMVRGLGGSEHPYKCKKCKIFICPRCYEIDVKDDKCPKCGGKVSQPVFGK